MGIITALLPREYMKEQMLDIIREKNLEGIDIKVIETREAISAAREAVSNGTQIIIARGLQASIIKSNTNVTVVEIKLTTQEIGILVSQSKKMFPNKRVNLALIGYKNMFSDFTYFNQIFDVNLLTYYVDTFENFENAVDFAYEEGADVVLGGDSVVDIVARKNKEAIFLASTHDSIRNSINTAVNIKYAINLEKNSNAQLETVMDTSFNGIIKIDKEANILAINRVLEDLLHVSSAEVMGQAVNEILKNIDMEVLLSVLNGMRDDYSTTIIFKDEPFYMMIAPIQNGEETLGAIISCNRMKISGSSDAKKIREMYLNGYVARTDFELYKTESSVMKNCVQIAKKYAISSYPVLIYGELGTEKEVFSECIHNNSGRKKNPFGIAVCAGMSDEKQFEYLFDSKKGLIPMCNQGTVYISEIDKLSEECQKELYQCIESRDLFLKKKNISALNVRIIAGTSENLSEKVRQGKFRKDLYYAINSLNITISPLRERKEDILNIARIRLSEFVKNKSVYLTFTSEALDALSNYSWPGNWIQFDSFFERLFITTTRKTIDLKCVNQLLEELYPIKEIINKEEKIVIYRYPEAEEIQKLLEKFHGNRQKVADEMGISTTTLWRKIKKYQVD